MQYPTLLEYMKAIQDAGNNLDKLAHLSVVLDGQGEPYHISGDSSVVFKMQDKTTGKCYALKCFTKAQKGCADASSNSSSVKFLEKELLVLSQGKEEKYPVELMDWVDGDSLGASQLKVEDMSTEATKAELNEAITDEFGVKYSKDGRKLLKVPQKLKGTYAIKEGTKIICNMVFCKCDSLNSVVIPDGVAVIGNDAFSYCESLTSLIIPNSVTSIGESAFEGCSSLTSLVIPDSVTSIRNSSFWGCSSLSSLVIPDSVTNIGDMAFYGCFSLRSLVISNSVTCIGDDAFWFCSSLRNLVIPDSVTSIGDRAFSGCCSLESLVIPDSVTSIGDWTFSDCYSLRSLVIPDSVTSIGDYAFSDSFSLESLVIPDSVTSIGNEAFRGCNFPNDLKQELISRFGEKIFG